MYVGLYLKIGRFTHFSEFLDPQDEKHNACKKSHMGVHFLPQV